MSNYTSNSELEQLNEKKYLADLKDFWVDRGGDLTILAAKKGIAEEELLKLLENFTLTENVRYWKSWCTEVVRLLYRKKVKAQEIADHLGISRQAVHYSFPKAKTIKRRSI